MRAATALTLCIVAAVAFLEQADPLREWRASRVVPRHILAHGTAVQRRRSGVHQSHRDPRSAASQATNASSAQPATLASPSASAVPAAIEAPSPTLPARPARSTRPADPASAAALVRQAHISCLLCASCVDAPPDSVLFVRLAQLGSCHVLSLHRCSPGKLAACHDGALRLKRIVLPGAAPWNHAHTLCPVRSLLVAFPGALSADRNRLLNAQHGPVRPRRRPPHSPHRHVRCAAGSQRRLG